MKIGFLEKIFLPRFYVIYVKLLVNFLHFFFVLWKIWKYYSDIWIVQQAEVIAFFHYSIVINSYKRYFTDTSFVFSSKCSLVGLKKCISCFNVIICSVILDNKLNLHGQNKNQFWFFYILINFFYLNPRLKIIYYIWTLHFQLCTIYDCVRIRSICRVIPSNDRKL